MANNGFGAGGFGSDDLDAMARQYWNSWGEMMRNAASASAPAGGMPGMGGLSGVPGMPSGMAGNAGMPGWNEAVAWWSQLAKGGTAGSGANETIDRFNSQARGWYAQMQQLASQFAGQDASASDVSQAWKRALGGHGENPFAEMFSNMRGPGQQGFDQWIEQAAPYLQGIERWQSQSMLGQPTFGFSREHQERWQKLAQAHLDYQEHNNAYNALMAESAQNAFRRFEEKLEERSEPGRQIESARALFDLWIDAAEDAYAEIALSPRFRDAYGAMVNSQMRLRASIQHEIENVAEMLGMPGRTEVDAAHRKIVNLEREMRRLRDAVAAMQGAGADPDQNSALGVRAASRPPAKRVDPAPARKAAKKPASKPAATRKAPVTKPATRVATGNVPAKKASTRQWVEAATRKSAAKPVARTSKTAAARATPRKAAKSTKSAASSTTKSATKSASRSATKTATKTAAKRATKGATKTAAKRVTKTAKRTRR